MDSDKLDDWLAWQETVSPYDIDLKLSRVQAVLTRLDLRLPATIITVAGTNGKGSSVAMLEAILAARGKRCGCYTSPHLNRYNERVRLAGELASDEALVAAFRAINLARNDQELTYFEFGTLAALYLFSEAALDVAILEVGLGGRLDAVNAVDAHGALITSIGLDHQHFLGDTLESIGAEKAGILRSNQVCVFAGAEMPASVGARALELSAPLRVAGEHFSHHREGDTWQWQGSVLAYEQLLLPALDGAHQLENAAGVLALLEQMQLIGADDGPLIGQALANLRLSGRLQRVRSRPDWYVDVGHNPAAASILAAALKANPVEGNTYALCAMLADKDVAGAITALASCIDYWFATDIDSDRALDAFELARCIANTSNQPCEIVTDVGAALAAIGARLSPQDRVLVFGSFHLVGPVLELLEI
ncbi:MAG: folylpolyglutamate synthase/dihydrofolate synthase family protein [Pseudomonadota bacterium]